MTPDLLPPRIASKIAVDEATGCWLWTAYKLNGYGRLHWGSRRNDTAFAHRVVYSLIVGPVPRGLDLDHLCRRPAYCNPQHVEPVTHRENVLRGIGAMTTCRNRLHPWVDDNIMVQKSGYRTCLACRRASYAARNERRSANLASAS